MNTKTAEAAVFEDRRSGGLRAACRKRQMAPSARLNRASRLGEEFERPGNRPSAVRSVRSGPVFILSKGVGPFGTMVKLQSIFESFDLSQNKLRTSVNVGINDNLHVCGC